MNEERNPIDELKNLPLKSQIVEAIRGVYDPEIPVNIYDLGLIYDIAIENEGDVKVKMTLTAPGCPVAGILPGQVEQAVLSVEGVKSAEVELVWDPPWNPEMMSEEAKLVLGFF
ncbi:MAG: SUF system Fe-S cluster assembly protein [Armatimonadetes bacterium]|nr:MAG: SUF system Fe-S cluster assembly protein [Armatimonadota bacterium]GIV02634.1 MAG: SUF system Fe-S cluster assembly protein [Fimbriimonadales bacterium]